MNELEKEFAPYQESLELKELGFDEPCFVVWPGIEGQKLEYDGRYFSLTKGYKNSKLSKEVKRYAPGIIDIAAPTFSQAFRWFREKYFIHHEIGRDYDTWDYELYDFKSGNKHIPTGLKAFETYEEAELACLRKLIEIVKTK